MSTGFLWRYQPSGNFNLDIGVSVQDEDKGLAGGFSDRSHGVGTVSIHQKGGRPHVEGIPVFPHLLDCEDGVNGSLRFCSAEQSQDNSGGKKADGQRNGDKILLDPSRKEKHHGGTKERGDGGPEKHTNFYRREHEWWEIPFAIFGFLGSVALLVLEARSDIPSLLFRSDFRGFATSVNMWWCLFTAWDTLVFLATVLLPHRKIYEALVCIYWYGFFPLWLWPLVFHLYYGNWAILAGMFLFELFWTIFCWSYRVSVSFVPQVFF